MGYSPGGVAPDRKRHLATAHSRGGRPWIRSGLAALKPGTGHWTFRDRCTFKLVNEIPSTGGIVDGLSRLGTDHFIEGRDKPDNDVTVMDRDFVRVPHFMVDIFHSSRSIPIMSHHKL
jgi:hypothetical protein